MITHSKKKNTGIIFRILTHKLIECSITPELAKKNSKKILAINEVINKYFKSGTELNKELKIYNQLLNSKFNDKQTIYRFLDEVFSKKITSKINKEKIKKEKFNLIQECYKLFDKKEFWKTKVDGYKSFAAVSSLLENKQKLDVKDVIMLEETIANHIINNYSKERPYDSDIDNITFASAYEIFNETCLQKLNKQQNDTIMNFITEAKCDVNNMRSYMINNIKKMQKIVVFSRPENDVENRHTDVVNEAFNVARSKLAEMKQLLESQNILDDNLLDDFLSLQELIYGYSNLNKTGEIK